MRRVDELGAEWNVSRCAGRLCSFPASCTSKTTNGCTAARQSRPPPRSPDGPREFYKRDLGQGAYSRAIGGELLPPEVIEACLLSKLLADLAGEGIVQPAVALSMPAGFTQSQRRARLDAAQIAGLDVLGTINDPLAAALTYAESQGYLAESGSNKPGQRVLVFDLGGSKLDVAIIEIKPGRLRTMAVGGNARLGGRDWDLRLAEYLAEQFAKQFGDDPRHDMISVRRLLESAEEAKQSLTARQQARVQVQRGDDSAAIIVTRQAFEDQTADLVEQRCTAGRSDAGAGRAWPGATWRSCCSSAAPRGCR